jgi:hypothetical protein
MDRLDRDQEVTVFLISEGGSTIGLDDGSKWKVAPYFKREIFDHWRHGDRVTTREVSDDPGYPWTIFNTDEGSSVAAKKID